MMEYNPNWNHEFSRKIIDWFNDPDKYHHYLSEPERPNKIATDKMILVIALAHETIKNYTNVKIEAPKRGGLRLAFENVFTGKNSHTDKEIYIRRLVEFGVYNDGSVVLTVLTPERGGCAWEVRNSDLLQQMYFADDYLKRGY